MGKKLDLIPELTTHKNDYKPWPITKVEARPMLRENSCLASKPQVTPPEVDWQSHAEYSKHVPFDLFFDAKPIIGTDPREPIPVIDQGKRAPEKKGRLSYKLPGKSTIEVTDEDFIRNILLCTYSPVHKGLFKDASLGVTKPPPLPKSVVIRSNVHFEPELYPPLPQGWLSAAKHWDCLQSRAVGDPTKTFWSRRGSEVECFSKSDCNGLIPEETKREIRNLIDEDRLRLPFNVTKTGYGGYRQICGKGVPLRRNDNFDS